MPYGGEKSQAEVQKMERCVSELQGKGYDKVSAIRICKDRIISKKSRRHK